MAKHKSVELRCPVTALILLTMQLICDMSAFRYDHRYLKCGCGLIGEARMNCRCESVGKLQHNMDGPAGNTLLLCPDYDEFHAPVLSLKLDRLVYVTLRKLAHAIYRDF